MTINIEEVVFECQGIRGAVKVADLPVETLNACLVYGIRRKVQDTVNSEANTAKKANAEFDPQGSVDAILEKMKSGTLGVRGPGGGSTVDPLVKLTRVVMREALADAVDRKEEGAAEMWGIYKGFVQKGMEGEERAAAIKARNEWLDAIAGDEEIAEAKRRMNATKKLGTSMADRLAALKK